MCSFFISKNWQWQSTAYLVKVGGARHVDEFEQSLPPKNQIQSDLVISNKSEDSKSQDTPFSRLWNIINIFFLLLSQFLVEMKEKLIVEVYWSREAAVCVSFNLLYQNIITQPNSDSESKSESWHTARTWFSEQSHAENRTRTLRASKHWAHSAGKTLSSRENWNWVRIDSG